MTTLPELLPENSPVVEAIYAHYKRVGDAEPQRGYLGASIIGHPCERYLWYTFRGCVKRKFDGRMYRLFSTGDHEEGRFAEDLRSIGCEVHTHAENGEQFAVEALGGHFSGHLDGCALGVPEAPKTWHTLEFKTHNAKSFARLKKDGVKVAKPEHYAQAMSYMHLSGMTRALYLAVNKDTDELHSERIRYDAKEAEALMERAYRVITAQSPPERIETREDRFPCRFCDAKDICFGTTAPQPALPVPALSCRQCCHATPLVDSTGGAWRCELHKRGLSPDEQSKPCGCHLVLPGLLAFAEPIDFGKDASGGEFILFRSESGEEWRHRGWDTISQDGYTSRELLTLSADLLTNKIVSEAKGAFDCEAVGVETDILDRYPESDSRIVWSGLPGRLASAWKELYAEDLESLTPVAQCNVFDHAAAEYDGGRVAIVWTHPVKKAEIRQGVE
jgi:hypothetical protein